VEKKSRCRLVLCLRISILEHAVTTISVGLSIPSNDYLTCRNGKFEYEILYPLPWRLSKGLLKRHLHVLPAEFLQAWFEVERTSEYLNHCCQSGSGGSVSFWASLVTYPRCCTRRPACCSDPAFFLHTSQQYRDQCCEAGELNCRSFNYELWRILTI